MLDPEYAEGDEDLESMGDKHIKVKMLFSIFITEIFEGGNIGKLIQGMFVYIKMQVENPEIPESCFTLD